MAYRILKFSCAEDDADALESMLDDIPVVHAWVRRVDRDTAHAELLVDARDAETAVDRLIERLAPIKCFHVASLPVEAVMPRPRPVRVRGRRERLGRQELYADVLQAAQPSFAFFAFVVLSSIVAAIGLLRGDTAVIIGAMVIAPLLGSNLGLALGTTLGDVPLVVRSAGSGLAGGAVALALALAAGAIWGADPTAPAIAARTHVGYEDVALALASGAACALSVTTGMSSALIGVMVAVALLPPTVTLGMLAGAGHLAAAARAAHLVAINLICVNLAGVVTFLAQGIRPFGWWDAARARRATAIAIAAWTTLLAALVALLARAA
ncbi:MAG: TIGR00341 family protein [Deltaproteobacteria bacterium]|nr:MAG: TIGR00341 family protein [Deltaproteobacteria bacterium]